MSSELPSLPRENIVLIGFMGSGKSAIGRMLAKRLKCRFMDTDTIIEERARMPIKDIFAKHGEAYFRERETAALASLAGGRGHIIATGGGIVTQARNLPLLHKLGWVVLLKADPDEIFRRVAHNKQRPLLQVENPRERVETMLTERQPLYEEAADFSVDSTGLQREAVVERVLEGARKVFGWKETAKP